MAGAASLPSFRSYDPAVIEYARYLGMDPVVDRALLWIAQEGIDAELPEGWTEYKESQGAYYHNSATKETTWTHPTDAHYWSLYRKLRVQRQATAVPGTKGKPLFTTGTKRSSIPTLPPAGDAYPRVPAPPSSTPRERRTPRNLAIRTPRTPGSRPLTAPNSPSTAAAPHAGYMSSVMHLVTSKASPSPAGDKNARSELDSHKHSELILPPTIIAMNKRGAEYQRPMSKVQRNEILRSVMAEGSEPFHLKSSSLKAPDMIARPGISLLWTPPVEKCYRVPVYKSKAFGKNKSNVPWRSTDEEAEEIADVAEQVGVAEVHLGTLYKAFKRHTSNPERFTLEEWGRMLSLIGIKREDVKLRMFDVWATGQDMRRRLLYKDAVCALCALGVGDREVQAEAIFKLCDVDNNQKLSRAELLTFAQEQHPLGMHLPRHDKSQLFVEVGKLFDALGAGDGKSEVDSETFVAAAVRSDVAWTHIRSINPYKSYFTHWDDAASGMQNVLNALFLQAEAVEQQETVYDRVKALCDVVDVNGDGYISEEEILSALMTLGYHADEADAIARESCGVKGMTIHNFSVIFTRIAEADIQKFARVEKSYGMHRTEQEKAQSEERRKSFLESQRNSQQFRESAS